jgi:Protein of unknown function (DUF1571)
MRRIWLVLIVPALLLLLCFSTDRRAIPPAPATDPIRDAWADDGSPLPTPDQFDCLARADAVACLDACLRRATRDIHGYRATLVKRETVAGTLHDEEEIAVAHCEHPFAVRFAWRRGARQADRSLFVENENGGQILVRPTGELAHFAGKFRKDDIFARDTTDRLVTSASRYPIRESSMMAGTARTWQAWGRMQRAGRLSVEYLGLQSVPEVGGRPCYVMVRTCDPPEEDGFSRVWVAIDAETWLQVASRLTHDDRLIGYYYFRDVQLNPTFAPDEFTRAGLVK